MATYAHFETTLGNFTVELFESKVPQTVANFAGLADGSKEWTHPGTKEKHSKPYYDGIVFHRVIQGFMIQGGDPSGDGTGGESAWGVMFADEIVAGSSLYRDGYKRGLIAMANAGPNTNGSQFFILHDDYPLPPRYVIFAKVTGGMDTVDALAGTPTTMGADGGMSRPLTPPVINKVTVRP